MVRRVLVNPDMTVTFQADGEITQDHIDSVLLEIEHAINTLGAFHADDRKVTAGIRIHISESHVQNDLKA